MKMKMYVKFLVHFRQKEQYMQKSKAREESTNSGCLSQMSAAQT